MIEITDVRIKEVKNAEKGNPVVALASLTIDGCFAVHNIKILETKDKKGYFIKFPGIKLKEKNEWFDTCHPVNKETRTLFEDKIFDAFEEYLEAKKGDATEE